MISFHWITHEMDSNRYWFRGKKKKKIPLNMAKNLENKNREVTRHITSAIHL